MRHGHRPKRRPRKKKTWHRFGRAGFGVHFPSHAHGVYHIAAWSALTSLRDWSSNIALLSCWQGVRLEHYLGLYDARLISGAGACLTRGFGAVSPDATPGWP